MNTGDKPLGKIEDTAQYITDKAMKNTPVCGWCEGKETYDVIIREDESFIMFYSVGKVHLCKKCYKCYVDINNIIFPIHRLLSKLLRRIRK